MQDNAMTTWLAALDIAQKDNAVLVTVAAAEGSVPREPGAKMLVTRDAQFDTIGGGHLEMRACDIAREMLALPASSLTAQRRLERLALGPGLGQCCGGVVHLAFERVERDGQAHFGQLVRRWQDRCDSWRLVALDMFVTPILVDRDGNLLAGPPQAPALPFDRERPCHVLRDSEGRRWLVDPCLTRRPELILFGAGHVGAAIVRALADLPCRVTWVDERDAIFPEVVPANVIVEATDTPEAVVDAAPAGASFLVMTHSHALDQRLAETILRRADVGWFGLIGSKTKRTQFEHRMRERGIAAERLADMVCPIGIPGITGKEPAVIAASVCAQLLQVWEAAARTEREEMRSASTVLARATA
jgi:xanthine dehydrogenase accessory factor